MIFLHVFSLSLIQVETSLTSPLCLVTGQKPATANQLHLRQHANSSGVKAHFGREHQPSPNLCPSSFSNHSSSLLPQQPALLSPLLPVNISVPCMPPLHNFVSSSSLNCLQQTFGYFFEENTFEKRNIPALLSSGRHLNHSLHCSRSQTICFFFLYYLQLRQCIMLLCIYELKTDNRGYSLPICIVVHMCIFRKPFFSQMGKQKCSIFYKRLLEVILSDGRVS